MKKKYLFLTLLFSQFFIFSQEIKNEFYKKDTLSKKELNFDKKQLIIPASLITLGIIVQNSSIDNKIQDYITSDIPKKTKIDDYLQYIPMISVYTLSK